MTLNYFIELKDVATEIGETTFIERQCQCGTPHLPLCTVNHTVKQIRESLSFAALHDFPPPEPATPFQTMRCSRCHKIVVITLASVGLVVP